MPAAPQPTPDNNFDRDVAPLPAHPRSAARQLAMQLLYQLDAQKGRNLDRIDAFLLENAPLDTKTRSLATTWTRDAWKHINTIDEHIRRAAINWDFHRIAAVDRAIIRLAAYHLLYTPDIPPRVTINEAIELAKRFSTAQGPSFVNGVLDSLLTALNPTAKPDTPSSPAPPKPTDS